MHLITKSVKFVKTDTKITVQFRKSVFRRSASATGELPPNLYRVFAPRPYWGTSVSQTPYFVVTRNSALLSPPLNPGTSNGENAEYLSSTEQVRIS